MTDEQYLLELEHLLMGIGVRARIEILQEVAMYFTRAELSGECADETVRRLGEPRALAERPFEISERVWLTRHHKSESMRSKRSVNIGNGIWPGFVPN